MIPGVIALVVLALAVILLGVLALFVRCYRKVDQGMALVRNGVGGTKVTFSGILVFPVLHKAEYMDISVNRLEIDRRDQAGLICKDNMRADITVAFFVRVNKTENDVLKVAQTIGCARASDRKAIAELFEAKFSEALKTVGRQFEFVELYNSREQFRDEILKIIGTDLNGYVLDDAAIDFLEQTNLDHLNPNNILDSEGIKKITELTANQAKLANQIARDKEKVIRQQDVEAEEAILELNRQLAESTEKQKREVATIKAREEAEAHKIEHEQRLRAEQARIATDEEIAIAEENKHRQVIVALKNKERTEAIENERVEKDRMLEVIERERIVALTNIEKDKAVEVEQKKIQDVIRERVMVQKAVVEEQERIKDTEAFAGADREKKVRITAAEMAAQEELVKEIKAAEAAKTAAELKAEQDMITVVKAAEASKRAAEINAEERVLAAEATQQAAEREAAAKKNLADAVTVETAAPGLGHLRVTEAEAAAIRAQGEAEAHVMQQKFHSEAEGIKEKAEAMKIFDEVGRKHEEFKLTLNKEKEIDLALIHIQKDIAENQAQVIGDALRNARVDIVGGDAAFFDRIVGAITAGKSVDRMLNNSSTLTEVKETFFNSESDLFREQLQEFIGKFGLSSNDLKNLTIAAALAKMIAMTDDSETKGSLEKLKALADRFGFNNKPATEIMAAKAN